MILKKNSSEIIFMRVIFFVFLLSVAETPETKAQVNTLYLAHEVPQSLHMNPAIGYHCRTFIELPVLSNFMLNVGNNMFSYRSLIQYDAQANQHAVDYERLRQKSGRNNRVFLSNDITLLGGGFERNEYYFSGRIGFTTFAAIGAPRDLLMATDGNWDLEKSIPQDINLSNTFLNLVSFTSISVAASTRYLDNLRIGGRVKYLQGAVNSNTKSSTFELDTEDNPLSVTARSNHRQSASFPMQVRYRDDGFVRDFDFSNSFSNVAGDFIFNKNRGMAIDAGMVYDYSPAIQFSASVTDVGFIWWKSHTNNFTEEGEIVFNGFDLNEYTGNTADVDLLEALSDSIQENFVYNNSQRGYVTMLPMRLYGGATYIINDQLTGGAVFRGDIHNRNIYPSLTFSLNYRPVNFFSGFLSYSLMNRSFNNIGAGFAVGSQVAQFYLVTDVIPMRFARDSSSGLLVPYAARSLNIQFGLNLIFGCKEQQFVGRSAYQKLCPAYD